MSRVGNPQTRRHLLLGGALALTLGAVVWVNGLEETDDAAAPAAAPSAKRRPPPAAAPAVARHTTAAGGFGQARWPDQVAPLFGLPPPPPPPRAASAEAADGTAAPPVKRAPPLPYTYFGRLEEGSKVTVFLSAGPRNLTARVGEVLDGNYRVEDITPSQIRLTYLPLNETQILNMGRSN